jgi:putative PIN family toxin of toxin-antitoxin system
MIRVVADTNVVISALMFGGVPGTFLDLVFLGSVLMLTSHVLLDELDEKLSLKFNVSHEDVQLIRARIQTIALVLEPDVVRERFRNGCRPKPRCLPWFSAKENHSSRLL